MTVLDDLQDELAGDGTVRLPALVRGRLVLAPAPGELPAARPAGRPPAKAERAIVDGAYTLRRPVLDPARLEPTGAVQTLVLPSVQPEALLGDRESTLELMRLPFADVLDYVAALHAALADRPGLVGAIAAAADATSPAGPRAGSLHLELLRGLLDPAALGEAVDRDLGAPGVPGRRHLDGWTATGARARGGVTAELRRHAFAQGEPAPPVARVRALPTRQLHITAATSPVIPLVCALRAIATKSPAVIKASSESHLATTLLAVAMHAVDPEHPITRHTSLVCWPGGDRRVEDVLLGSGRIDRLIAWASATTLESLRARARGMRSIHLEPRSGASLIGRAALAGDLGTVAVRAAADSLVENQYACTASLTHYVEASPDDALDYCEALRAALARWDAVLPHAPARESVGALRRLRRGRLARERWFVNQRGGVPTSSVVLASGPFDVRAHPLGRCVVVRAVADLDDAVRDLDPGVSTVGVAPEAERTALRDMIAVRGVSNVVPLGEAERAFAGMPHDGRRILSELVEWATA